MSYPQITANGQNFTSNVHHDTYSAIHPKDTDVKGRSVLITGASSGIGRATAIAYAKAGAARIAVAALDGFAGIEDELVAASPADHPPQILIIPLDIQEHHQVVSAKEKVKEAFGQLDILINCAGILEAWNPIAESDPKVYWKTWEVNYRGTYLMTKEFIPLLLADSNSLKTIVMFSSLSAHYFRAGGSAYQASKFAILRFTESVNFEYADKGLLCYAIHPGGVMTGLASKLPETSHAALTDSPFLAAETIVFLTKERREWLAGRYISCNWDMEELLSKKEEIVQGDKLKMRMVL